MGAQDSELYTISGVKPSVIFHKQKVRPKNGGSFTSSARPLTLFLSARSVTSNEGAHKANSTAASDSNRQNCRALFSIMIMISDMMINPSAGDHNSQH